MSFILGPNDDNSQIVGAVNYLLTNLGQQNALIVNAATGQIISPFTGQVVSYLYQYINVRYSTSKDGIQNFSTSPTNALYYGLQNSNNPVGSNVPSQYVWTLAQPPFSTTNYLWYSTIGGRQILWVVSPTAPNSFFQQVQDNVAINLDVTTTSSNTTQVNAYARIPGNPTPIPGTIVKTGQTLPTQVESFSTWGLNSAWSYTDPNPASSNSLYISNGSYNIATNETTWNTPYVGQFNVTQLSQITPNAGTLTSGTIGGNMTVNTTGNVTANVYYGNGSQLTDIISSYSDSNVAAFLPTYTGNVSANVYFGNGSQLTGMYSNANVDSYLPVYNGNIAVDNIINGLWTISVTPGANLLFQYSGTNVASLSSTGSLVLAGTLTQSGTPT